MVRSACLGMPHIGLHGEICDVIANLVHNNFKVKPSLDILCADVRRANWQTQVELGIDIIPCNDFTIYDNVLDTTTLVGNIPRRYYWEGGLVPPEIYFSIIRGQQKDKFDVHGMSSNVWFNTGFSFMVPEICEPINFAYSDNKPISYFLEAKKLLGITSSVLLLGPVSYMMLSDTNIDGTGSISKFDIMDKLLPVYAELFRNLNRLQAKDIMFEEPYLVKDLTREEQSVYKEFYAQLRGIKGNLNIHVITSFGSLGNNLECTMSLGVKSVHCDIVNGENDLTELTNALPDNMSLSLGLVDANGGWITDLNKAISTAEEVCNKIGKDRVIIAPSSSLSLCPLDSKLDVNAHSSYSPFLSFAKNKLKEIIIITKALNEGRNSVSTELAKNKKLIKDLQKLSNNINNKLDKSLLSKQKLIRDRTSFKKRKALQMGCVKKDLLLPITDIGWLPADPSLHSHTKLEKPLQRAILENTKLQERYLDIISSGEPERRNNIEYFASLIDGIDLTSAKVSRTSGSSYLCKPVIYDISDKVSEHYINIAKYCLSIASKPVRFSLIGPISLVNASFVPKGVDIHKCYIHFAHLMGQQIVKLQKIGIKHIMIDEPNLFQYIPLRSENVSKYIRKLGDIFKILSGYAKDDVQISLHLRGVKFAEYIESIGYFDADLLLLAATGSKLEVLEAFISYKYNNDIGIGLFNANSTRVPTKAEIHSNLRKCLRVLEESQLWITTDTGTRGRTRKEVASIFDVITSIATETRNTF
ncbi:MAG: hypothetical protein JJW01_03085 [Alphaproteobacteria bacterium]|nr:hypothetical protein [Rickettsiales bacterium]